MKKMKTAVIGCGKISDIFFENIINRFEILEIVACCSKSGVSSSEKAEKYKIKAVTMEEILNDTSIDLVINLTPPKAHYDIISRLLSAGKHVYTEKVITADFKEACELRKLAQKNNVRLGVAPDTFLGAGIQTARRAVEQGLIGTVTSCHASINRDMGSLYPLLQFTTEPGAGIGFDLGIYYLTALLSILGPVEKVSGMVRTNHKQRIFENPALYNYGESYEIQNENVMVGTLAFCNGVLGSLNFNGDSIFPEAPDLILYGTEGIISLPNPNEFGGQVTLQKKGLDKPPVVLPINYGFETDSRGIGAAEMAWAIQKDRPHRANIDMACHVVEILSGILKSSENNCSQKLESTFVQLPGLPEGHLDKYILNNPEVALIH